jgi:hypothetical protein
MRLKKSRVAVVDALHIFTCEGLIVLEPRACEEDRVTLSSVEARVWARVAAAASADALCAALLQAVNAVEIQNCVPRRGNHLEGVHI